MRASIFAKYFLKNHPSIFACCEGGHPHCQVLPGQVLISALLLKGGGVIMLMVIMLIKMEKMLMLLLILFMLIMLIQIIRMLIMLMLTFHGM